MKVFVRLAISIAALLVVSNVAFAAPTDCTGDQVVCYKVTLTGQSGPPQDYTYKFCLNNDGTGDLCVLNAVCADYLKVFGGGLGWFNFPGDPQFGGKPYWTLWVANQSSPGFSGIYQPIGEGWFLTGVETNPGNGTQRWIVSGRKVPCP